MRSSYLSFVITILTIIPTSAKAQPEVLELSPKNLVAGKSSMISLKKINNDASTVDVTSQYVFQYIDDDPIKKEISITDFHGKSVIFPTISGRGYTVKATNKSNPSEYTLHSVDVSPGVASKVLISSGNNQSGFGGEAISPLVIKVSDRLNNPVAGATVIFQKNEGTTSEVVSNENGLASLTYTLGEKAGKEVVSASLDGRISVKFNLTVKPLVTSVVKIGFASKTLTSIKDETIPSILVSQYNGNNSVVTTSPVNIKLESFKNSSCTVPTSTPLTGTVNKNTEMGTASFDDIKYSELGSIFIRATAETGEAVCSKEIKILQPITSAAKVVLATPNSSSAGIIFSFPQVKIVDTNGLHLKDEVRTITLSAYQDDRCIIPSAGTLSGTITRSTTQPITYFSGLSFSEPGEIYLKAESPGLEPACSNKIVLTENILNKLAQIRLQKLDLIQVKDRSFELRALLLNKFGSPLYTYSEPVTVSAHTDSNCSSSEVVDLSGAQTISQDKGMARFNSISFRSTGRFFLKVTSKEISSCSPEVTVNSPPDLEASKLSWVVEPPSSGIQNEELGAHFKLQTVNSSGLKISKFVFSHLSVYSDDSCSTLVQDKIRISASSPTGEIVFPSIGISSPGRFYFKAAADRIQSDCSSSVSISCPEGKNEENGTCVDEQIDPLPTGYTVVHDHNSGAVELRQACLSVVSSQSLAIYQGNSSLESNLIPAATDDSACKVMATKIYDNRYDLNRIDLFGGGVYCSYFDSPLQKELGYVLPPSVSGNPCSSYVNTGFKNGAKIGFKKIGVGEVALNPKKIKVFGNNVFFVAKPNKTDSGIEVFMKTKAPTPKSPKPEMITLVTGSAPSDVFFHYEHINNNILILKVTQNENQIIRHNLSSRSEISVVDLSSVCGEGCLPGFIKVIDDELFVSAYVGQSYFILKSVDGVSFTKVVGPLSSSEGVFILELEQAIGFNNHILVPINGNTATLKVSKLDKTHERLLINSQNVSIHGGGVLGDSLYIYNRRGGLFWSVITRIDSDWSSEDIRSASGPYRSSYSLFSFHKTEYSAYFVIRYAESYFVDTIDAETKQIKSTNSRNGCWYITSTFINKMNNSLIINCDVISSSLLVSIDIFGVERSVSLSQSGLKFLSGTQRPSSGIYGAPSNFYNDSKHYAEYNGEMYFIGTDINGNTDLFKMNGGNEITRATTPSPCRGSNEMFNRDLSVHDLITAGQTLLMAGSTCTGETSHDEYELIMYRDNP